MKSIAAPAKAPPGDSDRVEHRNLAEGLHQIAPATAEFLAQKRKIEANVVTEHDCALEQLQHAGKLLAECGSPLDHGLSDAGQGTDAGADFPAGIDQLLVLSDLDTPLITHDSQLDHFMAEIGRRTGSFDIDNRQRDIAKGLEEEKAIPWSLEVLP